MSLKIKVSTPELIRRAKMADPSLNEKQLASRFGVRVSEVRKAFMYRQPGGSMPGRQRA